jgi:hypothetical protein
MGKRSNFARSKHDAYDTTDPAAVEALLAQPDLCWSGVRFIEPCAGKGALRDQLVAKGLTCVAAYDIAPRAEGIFRGNSGLTAAGTPRLLSVHRDAQCFITNPPWSYELLIPILLNLYWQLPTWLLLSADFVHTQQAAPFMPLCRRIVSIGRMRWVEGSKHDGKDNAAWMLFARPTTPPPQFIGRGG